MRPANANLASLLASTRQLVFWEEFEFTLSNGSTLTYTTKDPDAVLAVVIPGPVPPPPSGPVWPLLDNFDGTAGANLSSHTGDSGNVWSGGDFGSPSDFLLDGSGATYLSFMGGGSRIATDGSPPNDTSDFYIEGNAVLRSPSTELFVAAGVDFSVTNNDNSQGYGLSLACDSFSSNLAIGGFIATSLDFVGIDAVPAGAVSNTPVNIRMEVTDERKTLTIFLDGANKGSASVGTAPTGLAVTRMGLSNPSTGNESLVLDVAGGNL